MSASVLALFLLLSRRNVDLQLKDVWSEKTGQAGLALERAGSLPVKDGLAPATIETDAAALGKLYQLDFVPDVFGTSKCGGRQSSLFPSVNNALSALSFFGWRCV